MSDVEIRRNEIIELLYTYKKYSIDDFAKRFGVSRRTINYDIVYLMDFYEIDTKPGPHGGISLIDRRPNSHTAYLKPIEIEWLRRKYNEAETEEDRMAAHSIQYIQKKIANGIPERFMQSCVMRNILETACTKKPTQRIHSH